MNKILENDNNNLQKMRKNVKKFKKGVANSIFLLYNELAIRN